MIITFDPKIQLFCDYIVCVCWIIAYALCLAGTIKEDRPGFPPLASCIILPWEVIASLNDSGFIWYYASISRLLWFSLHSIFFVIGLIKLYRKKPKIIFLHIILFAFVSTILFFVFKTPYGQIRTSFFNTILSWLVLLIYIVKTDYPPSRFYFGFAVFGFLADAAGHFLYLGIENITSILCVTLQIIQFIHVLLVYRCMRKANLSIFEKPKDIFNTDQRKTNLITNLKNFYNKTKTQSLKTINKFIKTKILKTKPRQKKITYKKKKRTKKTHRKK